MYAGLVKGFEGETWGGPPQLNKSASFEEVVAGVRRIVDIFVEKGYAIKGEVGDCGAPQGRQPAAALWCASRGPATCGASSAWAASVLP
eukprot:jgi/Tetstr1/422738/TSEL_013535.t1